MSAIAADDFACSLSSSSHAETPDGQAEDVGSDRYLCVW